MTHRTAEFSSAARALIGRRDARSRQLRPTAERKDCLQSAVMFWKRKTIRGKMVLWFYKTYKYF